MKSSTLFLGRSDSTPLYARCEFGGKGLGLYELTRSGFSVPMWRVLPAAAFAEFCASLPEGVADRVREDHVRNAPLTPAVEALLQQAWEELGRTTMAVRSSAAVEDGLRGSFAGRFHTTLNVDTLPALHEAVRRCWLSLLQVHGETAIPTVMAVVIQRMVVAQHSGVVFTVDPVSGRDEITIAGVAGLGDALVGGAVNGSTWRFDRATLNPLSGSGNDGPTSSTLVELARTALRIEAARGWAQDIEWASVGERIFILQARPVTTPHNAPAGLGRLRLWDNANIVESYGGVTLPLSFSFARYVYRSVYRQLCRALAVPEHAIDAMESTLRNMLGSFDGRVYYNLFSWYRLLGIMPGFDANSGFMESMMGARPGLTHELGAAFKGIPPPTSRLRRALAGARLVKYAVTAKSRTTNFLRRFDIVYTRYRALDWDSLSADACYELHQEIEDSLLNRWAAPLIGDILCMLSFGVLSRLSERWLGAAGAQIQNALLADHTLPSAAPGRALDDLAQLFHDDATALALLHNQSAHVLEEALRRHRCTEVTLALRAYIDRWGFRCGNELKFEQPDLADDPASLIDWLRLHTIETRCTEPRPANPSPMLPRGWRRGVYQLVLRWARTSLAQREAMRMSRAQIYSVLRRVYRALGRQLVLQGQIDVVDDVFYLTLEEIRARFEATAPNDDLKVLVKMRRERYAAAVEHTVDGRFVTRGPLTVDGPWGLPAFETLPPEPTAVSSDSLAGTGCCAGVVEGVVHVAHRLQDIRGINVEILVTERTDPGWAPVFKGLSGLIIERGSLLSHSAILAREQRLPTIVGVAGACTRLRTGMRVRLNGAIGLIEILETPSTDQAGTSKEAA